MRADPDLRPISSDWAAEPGQRRQDRFLLWPVLAPLAILLGFSFLLAINTMFGLPVVVILLAIIVVPSVLVTAMLSVLAWRRSHKRRALSLAVPLFFILATATFPTAILRPPIWLGYYALLMIHRGEYEAELPPAASDKPRFAVVRADGFFLDPIEIVFDESDEMRLPQGSQSQAWLDRVGRESEFGTCEFGTPIHLDGHYYIAFLGC